MKRHILPLIFLIIATYWTIKPLFAQGYFTMHDDTQVARVYEMWVALRDGMLPVRLVPDLGYGYGYPIFNFYAPLAYYIGAFFMFIGFNALSATKIMMTIGVLLSGVFMYLLAREFWGEIGGVISSLFYVFAPYHAVQIYIRGDVAEFWAYAFIPLLFLGIYKIFRCSIASIESKTFQNSKLKTQSSKLQLKTKNEIWIWVLVAGIGYAAIILSHNLTAMMVTPFLIVAILLNCYIAIKNKKPYAISYMLYALIFGLLLSAFYWFPAILEMQYTNVVSQIEGGADFRNHFVCFEQLWDSHWGFGGSAPGCIDGLSFKIGKLHILLTVLTIGLSIYLKLFRKKNIGSSGIIWFAVAGLSISAILMLEISRSVWESVYFMAYFQYPWRFLLLTSFFTSILSGGLWINLKEKKAVTFGVIIIFILLVFNVKLFSPQTILPNDSSVYTSRQALFWTASKISDEYMPKGFEKTKTPEDVIYEKIVIIAGTGKVIDLVEKTQKITFSVDALTDVNVLLRIAPFPAWEVTVDGGGIKAWNKNNGIEFSLPHGKHTVSVEYKATTVEEFGNLLSLIGISLLVVGIINAKRKE
ncbi:MAG: hypothetical protein HYT11_02620 [Candidatus Levybacteria bacterium]|nr:hypothetical protein [Candidatus Levybacteria bacterium]